jgi:hypothetical protein
MDRTIPFEPDAICEECGATGAFDFMGDYLCYECSIASADDGPDDDEGPIDIYAEV